MCGGSELTGAAGETRAAARLLSLPRRDGVGVAEGERARRAGGGAAAAVSDEARPRVRFLVLAGAGALRQRRVDGPVTEHAVVGEEAFDPVNNIAYAAAWLKSLRGRKGSWAHAVGRYHNGHWKKRGQDYWRRVYTIWTDEQRRDFKARKKARIEAYHRRNNLARR